MDYTFVEAFDVFIPGRLCILGEHTDWAAEYRDRNSALPCGHTLVCATNEGLFAKVAPYKEGTLRFDCNRNGVVKTEEFLFDSRNIRQIASLGAFFCYVAGTVAAVLDNEKMQKVYQQPLARNKDEMVVRAVCPGIYINNYLTTLPMQKGLSSSAAVCVLVALSFDKFYKLELTQEEIMEIAYKGEMMTPSRCGRMDQCVVMGPDSIGLMTFDNQKCSLSSHLPCGAALYFVVVDLNASKDTMVILRELNKCFPVPANNKQALMHRYMHDIVRISHEAKAAIAAGDVRRLGALMSEAQNSFDTNAMPNCPSQLTSPVLHKLMQDPVLVVLSSSATTSCSSDDITTSSEPSLSLLASKPPPPLAVAMKGVGSQGDGSAQLLCRGPAEQHQVIPMMWSSSSIYLCLLVLQYLKETYNMDGFLLTIPKSI